MQTKMTFVIFLCLFLNLYLEEGIQAQTASDLIGVNAQAKQEVDDQLQKLSSIREYHYWSSDQVDPDLTAVEACPDTDIRLNPSFDGSAHVNYDSWFSLFSGSAWPAANAQEIEGLLHSYVANKYLEWQFVGNSAYLKNEFSQLFPPTLLLPRGLRSHFKEINEFQIIKFVHMTERSCNMGRPMKAQENG